MTQKKKFSAASEAYFADLRRIHASGGATPELSTYGPLANLLNAIGKTLNPKVFCVIQLADMGAGHPDIGLYTAKQVQKGQPREGQKPERGVIEVKDASDDSWLTAKSNQVSRYWNQHRMVLVTNTHDFVLLGQDASGNPAKLETFQLTDSAGAFHQKLEKPRAFARETGIGLGEYLARVLSHKAVLTDPKDLAWLLASYARDGLARVEMAGDTPTLESLRVALEDALGVHFEGEKGARFFHSTLVQTLFYGVFSAWVLWAQETQSDDGPLFEGGYKSSQFNWREAVWHLRAPVLRALFQQLSDPGRLQSLGLVEVLDWTASTLDRVDRSAFFARFNEGEVVPYFYEPFLQAFDPILRKQLGVWYTPTEVVRYMVARVDRTLKDDLGVTDGLAAENVYVLDPCCGTGAYLAEILRRIAANLEGCGLGALVGARVKQAAMERIFGFEIMPAPFVVAHLQVGLAMQKLNAALANDGAERAGIFLTNALTGWESRTTKPLLFPELGEERDRAEQVKQETPILVILGNPPYNGFAGVAVDEEQTLLDVYRTARRTEMPDSRALHDLYVRFFRMAERRIAEKTKLGVICFISNYSWLDGRSFAGMREHYLEEFDAIRIDCLNGDVRKGGETPEGKPDPGIFSIPGNSVGIQVGTAITTLIRKVDHKSTDAVDFRNLWGSEKHAELIATAEEKPDTLYKKIEPILPLGLPFAPTTVSDDWFDWPTLPDLLPVNYSGINTNRDAFVIDIDRDRLKMRVTDYFNPELDDDEIKNRYPAAMEVKARYKPHAIRHTLLARGGPNQAGFVRHTYRPFDHRWLYWESETKLLNEKRPEYKPHVFEGNVWLSAAPHLRKDSEAPQACVTQHLASLHLIERGANMFPAWLSEGETRNDGSCLRRANLSGMAERYLERIGSSVEDLFHYIIATLHCPDYRKANAGALRMEWPRIPLPDWPNGEAESAAEEFFRLSERGRKLAQLLNPDVPVSGITEGILNVGVSTISVPMTLNGNNMDGGDFELTARWGYFGSKGAVQPGSGRMIERDYTSEELATLGATTPALGKTTFDIYLNTNAYWRNIPANVWNYKLGGYQVLKKWLSYREHAILGRALTPDEVQYFSSTARRIAEILQVTFSD